jgi:spore coat polysaccharide biosynthesis protein SpsF
MKFNADAVIKIPSDCPLIDFNIIDKVIEYFLKNNFDYVSNLHPATYPDGNDVEIIKIDALTKAWHKAEKDFEREHTTPYLWENPEIFKIGNVKWETDFNYSISHRWTIDYEEDYILIKKIYDELYSSNPLFTISDILSLLEKKPFLAEINSKYKGVNWYRHHLNELKTIKTQEISKVPE